MADPQWRGHRALSRAPFSKPGCRARADCAQNHLIHTIIEAAMPDEFAIEIVDMDLQAHVDEIVSFFMTIGVSREQAATAILDMIYDSFECYGTRH
jgi:hypothetical protein